MFEHTAGDGTFIPSYGGVRSTLITIMVHTAVLGLVVVIPLMSLTDQLPKPPLMMAFVAAPPPPPAPPPPAAPAPATEHAARRIEELSTEATFAAPVEVPEEIVPETGLVRGAVGGMPGGVEGGVAGGIVGGVLGGLPSEVPPPPAPPPPVAAAPVRVGGAITQPALVYKVPPVYPEVALVAQLQGTVILEATVDTDGHVESVRVLRSVGLLDDAAIAAVRQWRYKPLTLNGLPTPFILTVTVAFELAG